MAHTLNRRDWLRSMALLAGGAALSTTAVAREVAPEFLPYILRRNAQTGPVNLGSNENPFGPSEAARKAIVDNLGIYNRYPRHVNKDLHAALAKREGLPPEQIMLGGGSSELLGVFGHCFGHKGGNFVAPYPTFALMMTFAEVYGVQWNKVMVGPDLGLDLGAMERAINPDTKLVFVCNPNNPTGTLLPAQAVEDFIHRVAPKLPVIVDEAYIELIEDKKHRSMTHLIAQYSNVIVLRTFSKIYGLAGMRVGYAMAQAVTIEKLKKYQMGHGISVSAPAAVAALASMQDEAFAAFTRQQVKIAREYTFGQLQQMNLAPVPSHTNFMVFPIAQYKGDFKAEMLRRGYIIQTWDIGGRPYCRVSMGTREDMQGFVAALKEMMA